MLELLSSAHAQRLREFLNESRFTTEEFFRNPALRELPPRRPSDLPYLLECTREPSAMNVLLRLFLMGVSVDKRVIADVVPPPVLQAMFGSGILAADGESVDATVMLSPVDQYVIAADHLGRMRLKPDDVVLWPNQTTRILQHFALPVQSRETLDLGTGCGVIAVMAAARGGRVAATDLNPRAAEFVHFNARLNAVENIDSYTGDTFDPVAGRTFDLILSNPPFFIGPSSDRLFCDNAMDLDQYCRRIVREVPQYLNEGGYFQMIFEWAQVRGQPWTERLAEWVDGSGCDAWLTRVSAVNVEIYAYERTRDESSYAPEQVAKKFDDAIRYYREREVEQIQTGMLVMRRRSGNNWFQFEELSINAVDPFGDEVLTLFTTQDLLAAFPAAEDLLMLKPRLQPGTRMEQEYQLNGRQWSTTSLKLKATGAISSSLAVEYPVAQFLARCDGEHTLRELIDELVKLTKASPSDVQQQCCSVVRRLAERRFLSFD